MSFRSHATRALTLCTLGAALLFLPACSDDGGSGNGGGGGSADTISTFVGILSSDDAAESGAISIVISTPNPAPPTPTGISYAIVGAQGTLTLLGGASVDLTGSYDDGAKSVNLTGGGYSFAGGYDGSNRLEGTYTGPASQGTFVSAKSDGSVTAYCGSYSGDDQGLWNFVIDGQKVLGQAVSSLSGTNLPLDGSISGGTISIKFPGSQQVLATGSRNGTSVSGAWSDPNSSDQGTWTGSVCP